MARAWIGVKKRVMALRVQPPSPTGRGITSVSNRLRGGLNDRIPGILRRNGGARSLGGITKITLARRLSPIQRAGLNFRV